MQAPDKTAMRDAATIIVLRDDAILMGQRGKSAAFLPGKFVFPGGAVDDGDAAVTVSGITDGLAQHLDQESTRSAETLVAAAIRELWEETGQVLGTSAAWPNAPADWADYAANGYRPDATGLSYFFRAAHQ